MENPASQIHRPKLVWWVLLGYFALAGPVLVATQNEADKVWIALLFIGLAIWAWGQRLEIANDEIRGRWRIHRQPVELSDLAAFEVSYAIPFRFLEPRVTLLC